ncbi:MAG: hypothetical protein LBE59_12430, partial [Nevskiaceae bacterium]|nr:hypothetical protein [Nevskiaceae bacterium]
MRFSTIGVAGALGLMLAATSGAAAAAAPPGQTPVPVVAPAQAFATAEAHFNYLKRQANGGTHHTYQSIPKWEGLWQAGYNSLVRGPDSSFFEGPPPAGLSAGGVVKEGVFTPAYEAAFKQR